MDAVSKMRPLEYAREVSKKISWDTYTDEFSEFMRPRDPIEMTLDYVYIGRVDEEIWGDLLSLTLFFKAKDGREATQTLLNDAQGIVESELFLAAMMGKGISPGSKSVTAEEGGLSGFLDRVEGKKFLVTYGISPLGRGEIARIRPLS